MVYKKVDMEHVQSLAAKIRLLVLDVDGVLTDGQLYFDANGKECKVFHARDGYGIRRVLDAGIDAAQHDTEDDRDGNNAQRRAAEFGPGGAVMTRTGIGRDQHVDGDRENEEREG